MENKKKAYDNFTLCFIAGLCLTGISVLLFCLLGKNSIITYHDQLDGEVLCYIYQAKYLFRDSAIPELMNGVGKAALTAPAPLFVLFYKVLSPFPAFVVSQYFAMLAAFVGMYLVLTKWKVSPFAAGMCSVLFAYVPLLPVYGLSMYGVPLVFWAFLNLAECGYIQKKEIPAKKRKRQILLNMGIVAFFGMASSLVLSGYAVLAMVILLGLFWKKAGRSVEYWAGAGVLLLVYVLCNLNLFAQILGFGESYVTHKEELTIAAKPFGDTMWSAFINGVEHAQSYQKWIVVLSVIVLLAGLCKKEWRSRQWQLLCALFGTALGIAVLCGLYSCEPVVALREQIGGAAVWLQLDRIYWLYPALWYAVLGLSLQWLWQLRKWLFWSLGIACFGVTAVMVLLAGNWKNNVKKLIYPDSPGISWEDFYAEDVFSQVEAYLYEITGQTKDEYRVVSLGVCPAAALYNGFYCLDGYSNNYPLEYKHAFRDIMELELDKSDYLTEYFDDWGNRCYLLSSEIPGYYTVEKGGFYFSDFDMNTDAFKELGGDYVLSAAYIERAEETGLKLLREEPFETADSYYKIYIYGLNE